MNQTAMAEIYMMHKEAEAGSIIYLFYFRECDYICIERYKQSERKTLYDMQYIFKLYLFNVLIIIVFLNMSLVFLFKRFKIYNLGKRNTVYKS